MDVSVDPWRVQVNVVSSDPGHPPTKTVGPPAGALAGIYGLLLAIPVAACIKILLREVFWPRVREWTQGRATDVLPIGEAGRTP